MTTFATRSPLALLANPHMMNDARKSGRRTSDRLREKEDLPIPNGLGHGNTKGSEKTAPKEKANANGSETTGTGRKTREKRKLDDVEESDGFMFRRTRSKAAEAEAAATKPPPIPETIHEEVPRPLPVKKMRKISAAEPSAEPPVIPQKAEQPERRRRSPRNSGENVEPEPPPPVQVKKRRTKAKEPSTPAPTQESRPETGAHETQPAATTEGSSIQNEEVTKVALPFADTPIIRRNQEMRANSGQRRSSLGNRGRRASSLIDSGKSNALPHEGVDTKEYYKHIESGLPEPRRMRQLLTWCGTRALGDKPAHSAEDSQSKLAAREIQQQILKDLSVKSEFSDWFSRKESTPPPRTPRPNPKNLSNLSLIADLEQKIARLQDERQTWERLLQPSTSPLLPPFPAQPQNPHTAISTSLLSSPAQVTALSTLQSFYQLPPTSNTHSHPQTQSQPQPAPSSTLLASASSRIQGITSTLEFEIDKFAGNVHALDQYQQTADSVADQVLAMSAEALEERERLGKDKERENAGLEEGEGEIGTRDVLRGLSRAMER